MTRAYRRPRILLLEDERAEARIVTRILEDEGFDVETVHTGEDALGRLAVSRYQPYDLLVLDLRMPGLSGLHVVKFILHHRRDLLDRTLITSAATPREHPEMIGTASMEIPWLLKPYRPQDLVAKAKVILATAPPASPAWLSFR